jgi:dethiobiotin synthetase
MSLNEPEQSVGMAEPAAVPLTIPAPLAAEGVPTRSPAS